MKNWNYNTIAVIGLGYVGLPTAVIFAKAGLKVIGVDVNPQTVQSINSGRPPINEPGLQKLLKEALNTKLLTATTDYEYAIKNADAIIICVPTPIDENNAPILKYLDLALENVSQFLTRKKLVIIESTIPPGCTHNHIVPLIERKTGLKAGTDFWLAYCPERITPGKSLKEFIENDRIIGGYTHESGKIAEQLFKKVVKGKIYVTDIKTAEVAKIAENTFRDINIAFANELALICEKIGVDVMKVIQLANTHPRVNIHLPGTGVGGPCIPKDPYLLIYPAEKLGFKPKIIRTARMINDTMPNHVVNLILNGLNSVGKSIVNSKITILGTAYKGGVDDSRLSPAKEIINKLKALNANLVVFDPYCSETFGARSEKSIEEAVLNSDCIVLVTDHPEFRNLDLVRLRKLMKDNPIIVDGRRIIDPNEAKRHGFQYLGVGYGN